MPTFAVSRVTEHPWMEAPRPAEPGWPIPFRALPIFPFLAREPLRRPSTTLPRELEINLGKR